jgi:hypothetical protein
MREVKMDDTVFVYINLKGEAKFGDINVYGKIILKWIFDKCNVIRST